MLMAIALASLIGAIVGLLGGGGSILLLPVLVYVAQLPTSEAIALSLLVVAATSVSALPSHVRAGHVQLRVGLWVGAGAMLGAAGGARVSVSLPSTWLLTLFALVMIPTAIWMLRGRASLTSCAVEHEGARAKSRLSTPRALALGLVIGFVSGLVGAGGGFLLVPSFVLFGGLAMRPAIGTSLLVLALQASVGFVTHAGHAALDVSHALAVSGAAVAGSVIGSRLSPRVAQERLRGAFGWLVLVIGSAMLIAQAPLRSWAQLLPSWLASGWSALAGGALVGLASAILWLLHGRTAGVSGISGGLLDAKPGDRGWRAWFVLGLLAGGGVMAHALPSAFGATPAAPVEVALAGLLVGVGTTLANGCTSGHGVCGVSRLAPRSLAATAVFMAAGIAAVYVTQHMLSGGVS